MLCWFLPYNNTKYTYVYLYIYIISIHTSLLPKPPFPPPISLLQVITGCQIGFPVLHSNFSTAIHLIHNSVYMLMLLSFLFLSLSFFFFFCFSTLHNLWDPSLQCRNHAWAPEVVALSLNCWSDKVCQDPGNVNPSEVSQRFTSQHTDSALPNCLKIPLPETSGQTTINTGTKSYPFPPPHPQKKKWRDKSVCYRWRSKVKTSKTELVKRK